MGKITEYEFHLKNNVFAQLRTVFVFLVLNFIFGSKVLYSFIHSFIHPLHCSLWRPDGDQYKIFRNQFLAYSLYQSKDQTVEPLWWFRLTFRLTAVLSIIAGFVQCLQCYYQSGCLYRLRALGERHNMDLTVGEARWPRPQQHQLRVITTTEPVMLRQAWREVGGSAMSLFLFQRDFSRGCGKAWLFCCPSSFLVMWVQVTKWSSLYTLLLRSHFMDSCCVMIENVAWHI